MFRSQSTPAVEVVREEDLIPDNRLAGDYTDLLEHESIAKGVAEIALKAQAPVNIALFGPWGSGKSSVYSMIEGHCRAVRGKKVRVARYDAWKYGGQELKRNFIDSVSDSLGLGDDEDFNDGLHQEQSRTRLSILTWVRDNWISLPVGIVLAAAVAALWVVLQAAAAVAFTDAEFAGSAKLLIPQAGTVFGLALVAVLVGPKAFEGAVTTKKTSPPVGSDQFAKRFRKLVTKIREGKAERLVIFIDELDRCAPEDVVATLIDLKTFLDQENCAFIVAADRDVLERALRKVPQAKPVREDEPYYATPGAFLDKIFQHQISLPPLRARALTKFARDLSEPQGGVWRELRQKSQESYELAIFALIPVHVRSPRRVKVLLNNYATTVRIVEARGIPWLDRAHELAVLTVLHTEFPAVIEHLQRVPRLLSYIRGEDVARGQEIKDAVQRFAYVQESSGSPSEDDETPAGELLADPEDGRSQHMEEANQTLRRHLSRYLSKIAAAGIDDPRPDLVYLQGAAGRESLGDPRLGDVIDFAADTAPDEVVAEFAASESSTLSVAVPLLVIEGDNSVGPGQAFAYEAACRLIERIDPDHRELVAREAGPSLFAAAKAGTLSMESQPGALLVACWAGAMDVVQETLEGLEQRQLPADILSRLVVLLPYLSDNTSSLLVGMLADRFRDLPGPLLTALSNLPADAAEALWRSAQAPILEALNALETPVRAAEPQPAPVRPGRPQPPPPPDPEPTGEGVERLEELVDAVTSRRDGEGLLSSVFAMAQEKTAHDSIRTWALNNADRYVATMGAPALRARHALLGLRDYPAAEWRTWSALLPDALQSNGAPVTALAAEVLSSTLMPSLATLTEKETLAELPDIVARTFALSAMETKRFAELLAESLSTLGWEGADGDDEDAAKLWAHKGAVFAATAAVSSPESEDELSQPLVDDLAQVPRTLRLTASVTSSWTDLCSQLPPACARSLSDRVDDYEPEEGEQVAVLRMKLAIRAVFGGNAPPASEIASIPDDEQATAITDTWLALRPAPDDVRSLLGRVAVTPAALDTYATQLSTEERSQLWVAALIAHCPAALVRAAGRGGIGVTAVQHCREVIRTKTREPERTDQVDLLLSARVSSEPAVANQVKRAASELALDLLSKGVAGDLKSAAKLIGWADGPGYGHTAALREGFTDGVKTHPKALSKSLARDLVERGLLTVPKKGFLAKLVGR